MFNLCNPALFYLIIEIIKEFSTFAYNPYYDTLFYIQIVSKLITIAVITYALNYICDKYSSKLSWIISVLISLQIIQINLLKIAK